MPEPDQIKRDAIFSAELEFLPLFNLALQQNALPVVHALKLINHTEKDLEHLECHFSSVPEIIPEKTVWVEKVKSGEELILENLNLELNYEMLSGLSERVKFKLNLSVKSGEESVFQQEYDCEAFAPDQWMGLDHMPELLASFVTPNMEVVSHLQSSVAQELERATGRADVEGYQSDKKRVYEICAAIYRAIHNWGIQYSNPPSSFGSPGQRIRFADAIYQYKLGTCLDTTLLFASVMEACCLHPVIMLQRGHAYIGCHLKEEYFPDIPMDDLQTIRKLADLDDFLVIETTMVTGKSTFAEAEASARMEHLNIDDEFVCAIDVVRARYSGILPLPLMRSVNGVVFAPVERNVGKQIAERGRKLEREIDLSRLQNEKNQPERVARWTQKLLDLSLRNRLLNVRDTKLVIPIACPDITILEDKIAGKETLTLNSLPNLLGEKDLYDLTMLRNSEVKTEIKDLLEHELSLQRLWTILPPAEMGRRLTALYRQGKTDMEEGGVNTLYLAIGFVEWKVSERDEKSYLAPILLLPVKLQRKSIAEGIKISHFDSETMINETLLELLRSQYNLSIPGISPLPTDSSGVDVGLIMQIFRQAIKEMKGWEVREEARLGHFSFGKFVMWTDMTTRLPVLKQNPLISHLISGNGLYDDGIEVFSPEQTVSHLDYSKLFCPVSADSSQLAAVLYSEKGKSFVLHGPPGTGKSQTITNIIAHNLALGKRVLFVSEKKAALDVVHRRLSQIGLRPFCLELHSNKSGKTEVLSQFNEALQIADSGIPTDWESTVASLSSLRSELDDYVEELHRKYPNGFSAYDCFSRILSIRKMFHLSDLEENADPLAEDSYEKIKKLYTSLAEERSKFSEKALHALEMIDDFFPNPLRQVELQTSAENLRKSMENLSGKFAAAAGYFSLPEPKDMHIYYQSILFFDAVKNSCNISAEFLEEVPGKEFLMNFSEHLKQLSGLREKLKSYCLERFSEYDFSGISERISKNESAFFLFRFFQNKSLINELSGLKKSGCVKLSISELKKLIPDALQYQENMKFYEQEKENIAVLLGKEWNVENAESDSLSQKLYHAGIITEQLERIGIFNSTRSEIRKKLQEYMPDISRNCSKESSMRNSIRDLMEEWNHFQDNIQDFSKYAVSVTNITEIRELKTKINVLIEYLPKLRHVMRYRSFRKELIECGWKILADSTWVSQFLEESQSVFDLHYFNNMLFRILEKSSLLCQFSGEEQNEKIKKFRELDAQYMELTKKLVFARLAAKLPRRRSGPCPEGTELGILKRECEKRTRQKPVRMLLEQIPTLAAILKPCFLMSPLSVAQYLPADSSPFDLIVFDEASQIPVWDSIGVIARGKQLIVVGDPKQMPPTNFFQKGDHSEDDSVPEDMEDLESILDECIVAGVHSAYLNWHYRSRHESLIAFSNHHYYDNRLYTFPAARDSERLGVRFEFVPDGVYDRKGTRTNRKEAEALVKYIFDRLERSGGNYRSIGIVTFSQAQKDLIEDLLEKERTKHPSLESCFNETGEEPLFVKNLENVQGDERDVILFSIGYAPDVNGKFSMNFGPLNRQGGERRLNVAITRAKEQVVVFSSIRANQIELSRTNAVGAAHLKYFLDYAEKKVHFSISGNTEMESDGVLDVIAKFLTEKGFLVERNVGCSGYRIDLAVRHPDRPDEFLLGIESDNKAYASQNTARDRDNLCQQVLKGLGWHIYHAWSFDWGADREQAENTLLELIERLKNEEQNSMPDPVRENVLPSVLPQKSEVSETSEQVVHECSSNRKEYQIWTNKDSLNQEDFYESSGRLILRRQIAEIIALEAPIYESLLKRRIARAWGFSRIGGNIQKIIDDALPKKMKRTKLGEDQVIWAKGQSYDQYVFYRVDSSEETKRAIDEIPPEELANAMYEILVDFQSCEKDTLFRETVKLFGFSAVTAKARKYLEYGFAALQKSGRV